MAHHQDGRDGLDLPLSMLIAQLHSALNAQARAILAHFGPLNLAQWRIVRLVGTGMAESSTQVRKIIGLDKSQLSKELNALVSYGYITTEIYERDKRQQRLELTPLGREALDRLLPVLTIRHDHLMNALRPEHRAMIREALAALEKAAQKTDFGIPAALEKAEQ